MFQIHASDGTGKTLTSCFAISLLSDVFVRLIKPNLWFVFGEAALEYRCFPTIPQMFSSFPTFVSCSPIFMHFYLGHVKSAKRWGSCWWNVMLRWLLFVCETINFMKTSHDLSRAYDWTIKNGDATTKKSQKLFPSVKYLPINYERSIFHRCAVCVCVYLIEMIKHVEMMLMAKTSRILEKDDERMKSTKQRVLNILKINKARPHKYLEITSQRSSCKHLRQSCDCFCHSS